MARVDVKFIAFHPISKQTNAYSGTAISYSGIESLPARDFQRRCYQPPAWGTASNRQHPPPGGSLLKPLFNIVSSAHKAAI